MRKFKKNPLSGMSAFFDRILARGMLSQMAAFAALVFLVWGVAWLVLRILHWTLIEDGPYEFLNVYYVMLGGVDIDPTLDLHIQIIVMMIGFAGCVVLTGGLVAVCSNMVERRVELYQKGLVCYEHENHYLILGEGEATAGLLDAIFDGSAEALVDGKISDKKYSGEDIVVATRGNVEKIRERIFATLEKIEKKWCSRVYFYSNDMESPEEIAKLYPERAKAIFILGDRNHGGDSAGRDVKNLSSMGAISGAISAKFSAQKISPDRPVPIFVEIDRPETFSILQKLDRIGPPEDENVYSHPFNLHEMWARKMWGLYGHNSLRLLDYVPIGIESTKHVHLVIVGMNSAGTALVLEALRVCHYANYEKSRIKTKITIVDRDFEAKRDAFNAQFPYLEQIVDIDMEFIAKNVESQDVRDKLIGLAEDPDCLLTVAVCLNDLEAAFAVGLNFPEALYRYESEKKPYGNSVLIRQTELGELANSVDRETRRYLHVKVFGKFGENFDPELLNDKIPMRINYDYATFDYKNGDYMKSPLAENSEENLREMEKMWHRLPEYLRWSNRFQAEMFRTYLRTLGFDARKSEKRTRSLTEERVRQQMLLHKDVLVGMEHRRWCAERTLGGFVAGTQKDPMRRVHPDLVPTEELSEYKRNLDFRPIFNIPTLLAGDGWEIFDLNGNA